MRADKQWLEAYKKLPYEKQEQIFNVLASKMEKATNDRDGAAINRIEKALTRVLVNSWTDTATGAVTRALNTIPNSESRFTQEDGDRFINTLERGFQNIEEKTQDRVQSDIEDIYRINKERFSNQFDIEQSKVFFNGTIKNPVTKSLINARWKVRSIELSKRNAELLKQVEFGQIDAESWDNLARLENVSIGDHFPKTLKPKIAKAIQEGALEQGLNQANAGEFLARRATEIVGGNIAAATPASISAGQASAAAYFEGLNATNVTYARNFSHINLMREAEIQQIIFNAVLDRLTSQICSQMDGRIFTIEQAVTHQQAVLDAENVEELKSIAPFTRSLSQFGLDAGQSLMDPETQARIAAAGIIVPPLHFRCRSELQPF